MDQVLVLLGGGQDHNGDELGALVAPDRPQYAQAIELGQFEVEDDECRQRLACAIGIGSSRKKEVERLDAVPDHDHRIRHVVRLNARCVSFASSGCLNQQDDLAICSISDSLTVKKNVALRLPSPPPDLLAVPADDPLDDASRSRPGNRLRGAGAARRAVRMRHVETDAAVGDEVHRPAPLVAPTRITGRRLPVNFHAF